MMARIVMALTAAGLLAATGAAAPAAAMPVTPLAQAAQGDIVQVYHRGRPHRAYRQPRQRVVVHPHSYGQGYGYAYPDYYATYRGFEDPGFAVRGNMPGCAVDLGYGRWETCDK